MEAEDITLSQSSYLASHCSVPCKRGAIVDVLIVPAAKGTKMAHRVQLELVDCLLALAEVHVMRACAFLGLGFLFVIVEVHT